MVSCTICSQGFGTIEDLDESSVALLLSEYKLDGKGIYATPCGHLFHCICIVNWFQMTIRKTLCPICKKVIFIHSLIKIYQDWDCEEQVFSTCQLMEFNERISTKSAEIKKLTFELKKMKEQRDTSNSLRLGLLKEMTEIRNKSSEKDVSLQQIKIQLKFAEVSFKAIRTSLCSLTNFQNECEKLFDILDLKPYLKDEIFINYTDRSCKKLNAAKLCLKSIRGDFSALQRELYLEKLNHQETKGHFKMLHDTTENYLAFLSSLAKDNSQSNLNQSSSTQPSSLRDILEKYETMRSKNSIPIQGACTSFMSSSTSTINQLSSSDSSVNNQEEYSIKPETQEQGFLSSNDMDSNVYIFQSQRSIEGDSLPNNSRIPNNEDNSKDSMKHFDLKDDDELDF